MFSASGTNTPVPPSATPYHEQVGDTVTWIHDWYSPNASTAGESIADSVRLKGWFKTNINHKNDPLLKLLPQDVLDLDLWTYLKLIPYHHAVDKPPGDHQPSAELGSALTLANDDGQISGLGQ